jgi:DNA modification methylase
MIKPYYEEENITIYNDDCLEVMKELPDKSVDLTITSPPFKDEDVNGEYLEIYDLWFNEMKRVTSKVLIIIQSATRINHLIRNYPPTRLMIWGKGFSCYSWRFNPIFLYQLKADYSINKRIWCDMHNFSAIGVKWGKKYHKYQDPVKLYKTIIGMFPECEIIMDPFLGSGTSGIASRELGHKFIGMDIVKEFCETSKKRILGAENIEQGVLTE